MKCYYHATLTLSRYPLIVIDYTRIWSLFYQTNIVYPCLLALSYYRSLLVKRDNLRGRTASGSNTPFILKNLKIGPLYLRNITFDFRPNCRLSLPSLSWVFCLQQPQKGFDRPSTSLYITSLISSRNSVVKVTSESMKNNHRPQQFPKHVHLYAGRCIYSFDYQIRHICDFQTVVRKPLVVNQPTQA